MLVDFYNFFISHFKEQFTKIVYFINVGFILMIPFEILSYKISRSIKKLNWADAMWPIGFFYLYICNMLLSFFYLHPYSRFIYESINFNLILFFLLLIWSIRLFIHLFKRNIKKEDHRYIELTKEWKKNRGIQIFLKIFILQGFITVIISLPLILSLNDFVTKTNKTSWIFIATWTLGFIFELVADWQLAKFKRNHKYGEILKTGLWKYSQHPNYFGELLMWWSIFLYIVSNNPKLYLTIIGPILISYLIINKSGINLINKEFSQNKEYKEYSKKTAKLIPFIF